MSDTTLKMMMGMTESDDERIPSSSSSFPSFPWTPHTLCQQQARREGPGKARSCLPKWLADDYRDTCERLKIEMKPLLKGSQTVMLLAGSSTADCLLTPARLYRPAYFVGLPHMYIRAQAEGQ